MTDVNTAECEIFLYVDQDGDYVVAKDESELPDLYSDQVTSNIPTGVRVFALKLTVPLPKATALSAVLPDTDGSLTVTIT